jgi:Tfp pilus assembly protein PilF
MRQGLSLALAAMAAAIATSAPAHGAVTVFGGGYARDCYKITESGDGRISDAIAICDLALEQERLSTRDRAATFVNRGILKMRASNHEGALQDFDRSLKAAPNLAEAKINIGAAYYNLKRYDESLAMLNDGVNVENIPARSVAFYNRGLTREQLGDTTGAYYDYKTAVELVPTFLEPARQLERFKVVAAPTS